MTDPLDEISKIIEAAERDAFERGFGVAISLVGELLKTTMKNFGSIAEAEFKRARGAVTAETSTPEKTALVPRRSGRPASAAITIVENCIIATPGMKGVEVVRAVQAIASIPERTVRTNLRRLREKKSIWKRNKLWYPKNKSDEKNELPFEEVTAKAA
jgi:hypothetical protein